MIFVKNCLVCGKEYEWPMNESEKAWLTRHKYCSKSCANKSKLGKTPWNKGKEATQEAKTRQSIAHKGQHSSPETQFKKGVTPWNKGKIGVMAIPWNKGRKWVEKSGKNHHNWKGGCTALKERIRHLFEYNEWRSKVFKRDNWTCQCCGRRQSKKNKVIIEAHHLKPFYKIIEENKIKSIEHAIGCKELWDINNGQTLCIPCHEQTDSYKRKPKKVYSSFL